ncbi:tripartite tricarboxylate transporter permease [Candidatus Formimonas warabiya]|uniref:DUF112 domain-containing protein n=1 Tax=Formimonas warabiya TaxID=1761012 RepID=A0A3G1KXE6_FORW1|nr:tripartite tricarboxylate transporter permease [Candidatus Formimonas warabiya]ATW27154.1 hypothetical protein DCMF_22545 [Candidatus Formimonas warabiya]
MEIASASLWLHGFGEVFSLNNLMFLILGTLLGMIVGVLPGIGPNFGVALLLPMTFTMPPATAIIFLCSVHAATAYGDSIASILINVPGGGGSVPACWDGHPLSKQGRGGLALGLSATASLTGGVVSWFFMVLFSPLLVAFALKLGPPEIFMVALLALSMLAVAVKGNTIKGMIMACIGLMLSFIGMDEMTGLYRYTFGIPYLEDGIDLIPVVVGMFAMAEVYTMVNEGDLTGKLTKVQDKAFDAVKLAFKNYKSLIRGVMTGVWMGILPALGINAASMSAYLLEKQSAKDKADQDSFGKGNPKGVIAPEGAKGACVIGDLVPTFTLGIPGSGSAALLMAALIVHGLRPGPDFFQGDFPYIVFAGILIAQFSYFLVGIFTAKYWAKIIQFPVAVLAPAIAVIAFVGVFADNNRLEVAIVLSVFGFIGYFMNKYDYPAAALILGLVLGNLVESNFSRSMMLSKGSYSWAYMRPITLVLLIITIASFAWPWVKGFFIWVRGRGKEGLKAD